MEPQVDAYPRTSFNAAAIARDDAIARVDRSEEAVTRRVAWDRWHQWRVERIGEIDHTLAHHWADMTLHAVHADDSLAFGTQTLRAGAATYLADLQEIIRGLPDNRHDALTRAQTELRRQQHRQRNAKQSVADAHAKLEQASRRHGLRRDKAAITSARDALDAADDTLALANEAVGQSQQHVADEQRCVTAWETAFDATAAERTRLTEAVSAIYDALDRTRLERILAATTDPTHDLWSTLGPPPNTRGGLAAWCGIAEQQETWNDRHPTPDHLAETLSTGAFNDRRGFAARNHPGEPAAVLISATNIVHIASRLDPAPARASEDRTTWQATLETARHVLEVEHAVPQIEHDLGLEL